MVPNKVVRGTESTSLDNATQAEINLFVEPCFQDLYCTGELTYATTVAMFCLKLH